MCTLPVFELDDVPNAAAKLSDVAKLVALAFGAGVAPTNGTGAAAGAEPTAGIEIEPNMSANGLLLAAAAAAAAAVAAFVADTAAVSGSIVPNENRFSPTPAEFVFALSLVNKSRMSLLVPSTPPPVDCGDDKAKNGLFTFLS